MLAPSLLTQFLLLGFCQGIFLAFIPEKSSTEFAPLWTGLQFILFHIPILWMISIQNVRKSTLAKWLATTTILVFFIGFYSSWRDSAPSQEITRIANPFASYGLISLSLFIAQAMLLASEHDGKVIARYETYFEKAWDLFARLCAANLTVLIVVGVWFASTELLRIAKVNITDKEYIYAPLFCMSYAYSFYKHSDAPFLTSVRHFIISALKWTFPVAILVTTPYVGLLPFAAAGLHTANDAPWIAIAAMAAILIVLFNGVYQKGSELEKNHLVFRFALKTACVFLPILSLFSMTSAIFFAADNVWTVYEIYKILFFITLLFYSLGYLYALRTPDLKGIQKTNIYGSALIVLLAIAIHTPLLDPARLSTPTFVDYIRSNGDNLTALPDKRDLIGFKPTQKMSLNDVLYQLNNLTGRYGKTALRAIANDDAHTYTPTVVAAAKDLLKKNDERYSAIDREKITTPEQIRANFIIVQGGTEIPDDFVRNPWERVYKESNRNTPSYMYSASIPTCFTKTNSPCKVYIILAEGSQPLQILVQNWETKYTLFSKIDNEWTPVSVFETSRTRCLPSAKTSFEQSTARIISRTTNVLSINGYELYPQPVNLTQCTP